MRATLPPPPANSAAIAVSVSPYGLALHDDRHPPMRPMTRLISPDRLRPMTRDMSDVSPGTYVVNPDTVGGIGEVPANPGLLAASGGQVRVGYQVWVPDSDQ